MKIKCPNCGQSIVVNDIGRKPLNITVNNVCDALRLHRNVLGAANELKCSRAYIYKVLKADGLTVQDIIKVKVAVRKIMTKKGMSKILKF
jgi:hypothetical protein